MVVCDVEDITVSAGVRQTFFAPLKGDIIRGAELPRAHAPFAKLVGEFPGGSKILYTCARAPLGLRDKNIVAPRRNGDTTGGAKFTFTFKMEIYFRITPMTEVRTSRGKTLDAVVPTFNNEHVAVGRYGDIQGGSEFARGPGRTVPSVQ